jgi:hypothetical protein
MRNFLYLMTIAGLTLGSCTSNSKDNGYKKAYDLSQKAGDHVSSSQILLQWVANDSSIGQWAYDSLAFYHYYYAANPATVRNPSVSLFYVEKGLALNGKNEFLKDIKGKLLLEQGKDTLSYNTFMELWNTTNNYSYYWDMAFIETARGKMNVVDSMIQVIMKAPDNLTKKVKMEHLQAQVIEEVPAKAAFLYLNALLQNSRRDMIGSAESIKEALQIAPKFYAAQRFIVDMQRAASQAQGGNR